MSNYYKQLKAQIIELNTKPVAVVVGTISQARPQLAKLRHEHFCSQFIAGGKSNIARQIYTGKYSWTIQTVPIVTVRATT